MRIAPPAVNHVAQPLVTMQTSNVFILFWRQGESAGGCGLPAVRRAVIYWHGLTSLQLKCRGSRVSTSQNSRN